MFSRRLYFVYFSFSLKQNEFKHTQTFLLYVISKKYFLQNFTFHKQYDTQNSTCQKSISTYCHKSANNPGQFFNPFLKRRGGKQKEIRVHPLNVSFNNYNISKMNAFPLSFYHYKNIIWPLNTNASVLQLNITIQINLLTHGQTLYKSYVVQFK